MYIFPTFALKKIAPSCKMHKTTQYAQCLKHKAYNSAPDVKFVKIIFANDVVLLINKSQLGLSLGEHCRLWHTCEGIMGPKESKLCYKDRITDQQTLSL